MYPVLLLNGRLDERRVSMSSDNASGADNQQGSRRPEPSSDLLTPQRPHAELLDDMFEG